MTITIIPEGFKTELGDAIFLGNYESNSPEWHELRGGFNVGGSEVGTICGVNPWESPFSLWAKKTNRLDDSFQGNEAMEWGSRLESVILQKFAEEHTDLEVFDSPGTYRHKDREWQIANPDGVFRKLDGSLGIIEIKTARYEDDWINGVPAYYRTQVQWYLQTFGFASAYVAVLFSGSKYKEFEVIADDFEQNVNLAKVEQFRIYMIEDKQPDFDGALATYETVRQLNPDIIDDEEELGDLGIHYVLAVDEHARTEKHLLEMKSRVLDAMGKKKRGLINGEWKVTRQARGGGSPYLINKKG